MNNLVGLVPQLAGVIMVTIPSQVAEATVRRSMDFVAQLGIPLIGLVRNMDGLHCPQCGTAMELFPAWDVPAIAPAVRPYFTVGVPFDPVLARCSDRRDPYLLVFGDSLVALAFQSIAGATMEFLGLSDSQGK